MNFIMYLCCRKVKCAIMRHFVLILVAVLAVSCTKVIPFHVPCKHERMDTVIMPGEPYCFGGEDSEIVVATDCQYRNVAGSIEAERLACPEGAEWCMASEYAYLIRSNTELKQITNAKFPGIDFSKNSLVIVLVESVFPIYGVNTSLNGCDICNDIELYMELNSGGRYQTEFELIILKTPKISKKANSHIGYMESCL